jgi:hypothetical protein
VDNVPLAYGEIRDVISNFSQTVDPETGEVVSAESRRVIDIDIKPGSEDNAINNDGHGVIPVAILGREDFDVAKIDPTTVELMGMQVKVVGKGVKILSHLEDINGDGIVDLMNQIEDEDGTLEEGTTEAILTGNLKEEYGGWGFEGTDMLWIVPLNDPSTKSATVFDDYEPENRFELFQNYPNPFQTETTIWFALPETDQVRIELFDAIGRKIEVLTNQEYPSGYNCVRFENGNLVGGYYYYRIVVGEYQDVKRMIIMSHNP